jgi:dihydrofolate synthase/folylpolyglutamate synthase
MVRVKQDLHYQYYKAVHNARREMLDVKTDLLGNYQQHNLKTVLSAIEILTSLGLSLTLGDSIDALSAVKKATGLRGRWEVLQEQPTVICDVAHNPAGITEVVNQLNALTENKTTRKHIVLGFVKDKDVSEALSLLPKDATYYFCNAAMPRALPANELMAMAHTAQLYGKSYETVTEAVLTAKHAMAIDDVLLITGSFFIVGEAMEQWNDILQ